MQADVTVTADTTHSYLAGFWSIVDTVFSALWSIVHPILATIDPLCGPIGVFSLL
eukprot:gene35084-47144_t